MRLFLQDNCDALDDLQFNPQKIGVLTNVVGAISECAKTDVNVQTIKEEDGLTPLIQLIATNHPGKIRVAIYFSSG